MSGAYDIAVIGGGLVGGAIAWGAARLGARVALIDEGDVAYRAARGNFGLVWVQSKGADMPAYARWTRRSSELWPELQAAMQASTGVDVALHQPGGLHFCLSDAEMESRAAMIHRMHNESGNIGTRMVDRAELRAMVPAIGDAVVGASYCPIDGHANPLYLLRSLHRALLDVGGDYLPGRTVDAIDAAPHDFAIRCGAETIRAGKVVIAAGLGSRKLAPMVGLDMPVDPLRGQIIVTERVRPFLDYATHVVRQTDEGSVMLGDSQEDVGFDNRNDGSGDAGHRRPQHHNVPAVARRQRCTRLGRAACDDAGRQADLRTVRALSRRLRGYLPQRRDPRRQPTPSHSPPRSSRARFRKNSMHSPADASFRRLEPGGPALHLTFEGEAITARAGDTVAAALLARGRHAVPRHACHRGAARALVHDGRLLRLPGGDRRRREPSGLHGRGRRWDAHPPPARRARPGVTAMGMNRTDAVVIGAGPAGLAAATLLATQGASVVLLDEQPAPGGQIYRGVEQASPALRAALGKEYQHGAGLAASFRASGADYRPGSMVWQVTPAREVWFSRDGRSELIEAGVVILATGAMERAGAGSRLDHAGRDDGRRGADPAEDRQVSCRTRL